jgi:hypothetical protein
MDEPMKSIFREPDRGEGVRPDDVIATKKPYISSVFVVTVARRPI